MIVISTKHVVDGEPRAAMVLPEWPDAMAMVAAYLDARVNSSEFAANQAPYCGDQDAHKADAEHYRDEVIKLSRGDRSPVAMWMGPAITWALNSAANDGFALLKRLGNGQDVQAEG